jgi:UDP-N-acetylmuramate--alanine ligase
LNVDREHIDYYKSYSALKTKIKRFILKTSLKSKVIINTDDKFLDTINTKSKNIITFGKKASSQYSYKNVKLKNNNSTFDLYFKNKIIQKKILSPLLGGHNIQNLTAALSVINNLDIKINKKHIMTFKGTMRRMNILGVIGQSVLIDDYAHHPTEIQKLIEVSNLYKNKEVYLIIEPHRYTRLNDLYNDYLQTLKGIKKLNILKTYTAGEVLTNKMKDSKNLVNDLNVLFSQQTSYLDTYLDFFNLLDELTSNNKKKVIIAAGAGSISNQFRLYYETKKR